MALQLMDPINKMPFFQANQVLTYNHLNELAAYLFQQERYTRNKLIGSGIVCGLTFSWKAIAGGNAEVLIDEGCAITSAGYLIVFKQPVDAAGSHVPYTHRRNFTRLKEFEPFKTVIGNGNPTIYELITKDVFDAETDAPKSVLKNTDKTDRVLILLYDIEALNIAKCLDESCDDKGKIYQYTPRPLLVPVDIINSILNANSSKPFFTEPGRSAKGKESTLFETDYLYLKNLFKGGNLQSVNTPTQLVNLFKDPCKSSEINVIRDKINTLIAKFPWIFETQFECMKTEVPALAAQTLGAFFKTQAETFRDTPANNNYIQYLYDFLRDVVDAYNELYTSTTDLIGECGGNEFIHPFHVMLGLPTTNDTLACYKEEKFNEHNFKYRHYFVPSPVMDGQFTLYERVQNQFKRLVRIIANFTVNTADTTIRVTPGRDYDTVLGSRAVPYFYLQAAINSIQRVWRYDLTRRNKISRIKGYQLNFTQDELLDEDTSKNDFYRVEGHIGSTASVAQATIDAIRNTYNLPFDVATVTIQQKSNTHKCTFSDLEEEFNYYRDRVLGYLREIQRWLESMKDTFAKSSELKDFYEIFLKSILKLREILTAARCIENFNYNAYKKTYKTIWDAIFELYVNTISKNTANANQTLNSLLNVLSIIFFCPIYRIWYMYQYRISVLTQSELSSLKLLATRTTGLEHLAGVRRGNTFLLVSDTAQGDTVVADFSLPDLPGCACDCKPEPCDEKKEVLVSPLQKPIIMVVDYAFTDEKGYSKSKAYFNSAQNVYTLELDSMGFYKADSTISAQVKITDEQGGDFNDLKATWENEKLLLQYKAKAKPDNDGVFKLNYELKGNFDEGSVRGIIYLFVIGRIKGQKDVHVDVTVGDKATEVYPYDDKTLKDIKPDLTFEGETKVKTVGGERVSVYTTPNGNEIGIFRDDKGLAYLKVINAKVPGVEEIPFTLESSGNSSRGAVKINVINKRDTIARDIVTGVIKGTDGQPVKDVRITTKSGLAVITDEKGIYTLSGVKVGDVITAEKEGYQVVNLQANSNLTVDANNNLNADIQLEKAPLLNIRELKDVELPGNLGNLSERLNILGLRNLMK